MELTGGRQRGLVLGIAAVAAPVRSYVGPGSRVPRPIVPTEAELTLHTRLFNVQTRGSASLPEAHAWLYRLLRANAERRVYAPAALARVLVLQWLYVCQAAPGSRLARLRAFVGAKLVRAASLSPGQWVGLLVETARKAWRTRQAPGRGRRGEESG